MIKNYPKLLTKNSWVSFFSFSPLPPSPLSLCHVSSASSPKRPSNARSSPLETHGMIDQTLPPEVGGVGWGPSILIDVTDAPH